MLSAHLWRIMARQAAAAQRMFG